MSHLIEHWQPEDKNFWQQTGKKIATRNLWISIPALLLAFAIWQVWSVAVVNLPNIGFKYSENQLFWLAALPALSGATLRIFYSFMVPIFGGRKWTAISTASLLLPAIGLGFAVQNPNTSYITMMVLALLCGFGGGNFSSSMSNISFFFPKAEKGTALGLNAGLGNLGVSAVQFVVPLIITAGVFGAFGGEPQTWTKGDATKQIWLQNAGFIWVPFIILSTLAAWFGMNDLASAKASFKDQAVIFSRKHNWIMCILYLGTFGSFIGFAAGFPLLIKSQFTGIDPVKYAFLGPLVGALARPFGGWISDKIKSGALITQFVFIGMIVAVCGVIFFLPNNGEGGNFWGFFACFLALFALTGIGNGSTFMQVPVIFLNMHQKFAEEGGLVLGSGIAKELDVKAGDWVSLLISQPNGEDQMAQSNRERVQVTAILRLDGQLDHSYALLALPQAQELMGYREDQITGVELKVDDPFKVQEMDYSMLNDYPQLLYIQNWVAKFGYMYRDIQLIRTVMYIAMVLVIGVACFNIVSTLIMAVKDKQGDIAIMRTLGANNGFIKQIFIWYGLLAGMKGCLIGIVLGVVLALNLTPIIQGIETLLGKKLLSDGIYFVDFLPSELHWFDVVLVLVAALVLSLLASLYPASRAAKLQPAQVLSNH